MLVKVESIETIWEYQGFMLLWGIRDEESSQDIYIASCSLGTFVGGLLRDSLWLREWPLLVTQIDESSVAIKMLLSIRLFSMITNLLLIIQIRYQPQKSNGVQNSKLDPNMLKINKGQCQSYKLENNVKKKRGKQ